jgi:flagellin-like hook-associated protein FlgL
MGISLTAQMTTNLMSLQSTAKLMGITQERLATGKKVNSAIDDPVAFFDADAHYQLANDYAALKNGMSEAVQTIKAAADTIESIKEILLQMKSVATSAKSVAVADRGDLVTQYGELKNQLDNLAGDAMYKGINLLASGNTLSVIFNTEGDKLDVSGVASDSVGLSIVAATSSWAADTNIDTDIGLIDDAITTLRTTAKTLASNLSVVTTRQNFTDKMIATLKIGGDNLTLADMNEEGANMLMLQTRQALGIQSLSMASQSAQQVLSLFR